MGFTGFYCFFSRIYLVQPSCNGFQWVLPSFSCRVVPSFAGPLIGTQRVPFSRFAFRYCRLLLRSSISAVVGRAGLEDEGGGGLGGQRTRARLSSVDLTPPSTLPTHSTPYPFPLMRTHFSSRILSVCVFPVLRVYCVYTSAFRNFFCYLAFRFLNHSLSISREAESVQLDYYRIGKRFSSQ